MTAREAIELAGLLKPRRDPDRYEGWARFKEGRAELERALADAPADVRERFAWL
jgi:hypothetical protein